MATKRSFLPFLISALGLSGCGTYVPDTQDFPGNTGDQMLLVQSVIKSVRCEVANAINDVYDEAKKRPELRAITQTFDKNWGIQLTLSLKTEEKGTLNPTVVWTPPNPATALFSLSGAATLTTDAVRTDKLYFYYKVKELKGKRCQTGEQPSGSPVTSPLIQKNLKFGDWLFDVLLPADLNEITLPSTPNGPLKQNALYYEVSFEITTTGGLSPMWKFTNVNVNPTGTLASATRDRTHDLQIAMGPGDATGLKGTAAVAQQSGDIAGSLKGVLRNPR